MPRPRSSPRGASLIELMISMAILAVGLLAMWHLHIVGITSTAAGRRHTIAMAIARELVTGLERLSYTDHLLDVPTGNTGPLPGAGGAVFGALVDGSGAVRPGAREWNDNDQNARVPGVRLDSQMREKGEGVGYERRWTVWGLVSPDPAAVGFDAGVKLIAVSVVWRDPPFARPREVVLYAQVPNPAAITAAMGSAQ